MSEGKNPAAGVFSVKDPNGLSIILRRETWDNHILPRHPELARYLSEVQEVLKEPDLILEERHTGHTRQVYVRDAAVKERPFRDKQLVVYVAVPGNRRRGYVCTAHFAKGIETRVAARKQRVVYTRK
jgi:hypothetical protein